MTTYADKDNPLPVGLPLSEVAPATLKGNFSFTFDAAPDFARRVAPGGVVNVGAPNQSNWIIHTRSVLGWSITVERALGATMIISLGVSEYAALAYEPPNFLPIFLQGEMVWNYGSGLELPGNTFMRITMVHADEGGTSDVTGTFYLRGF